MVEGDALLAPDLPSPPLSSKATRGEAALLSSPFSPRSLYLVQQSLKPVWSPPFVGAVERERERWRREEEEERGN